jgi:hypothetical protein
MNLKLSQVDSLFSKDSVPAPHFIQGYLHAAGND